MKKEIKDDITIILKLVHEPTGKEISSVISLTAYEAMRDLHDIDSLTEIMTQLLEEFESILPGEDN